MFVKIQSVVINLNLLLLTKMSTLEDKIFHLKKECCIKQQRVLGMLAKNYANIEKMDDPKVLEKWLKEMHSVENNLTLQCAAMCDNHMAHGVFSWKQPLGSVVKCQWCCKEFCVKCLIAHKCN